MTVAVAVILLLAVVSWVVWPLFAQAEADEAPSAALPDELWAREKAVAVLAITEADFDRATGKLSEDDYDVLRSDYEGRALHAMDELDKLDAMVTSPTPRPARFCGDCGSPCGEDDVFCGGCGRRRDAA